MEPGYLMPSMHCALRWVLAVTLLLAAACGTVEVSTPAGNKIAAELEGQEQNTDEGLELLLAAGMDSIRSERTRLANGLLQLRIPARSGELARITLAIKASNLFDPSDKAGIGWLTAHSLRESGVGGLDSKSIDESLITIGAELELVMHGEQVYFEGVCPEAQLPKLAQILFGLISQAAPSDQVIDAQKSSFSSELEAEADSYKRRWQIFRVLGRFLPTPSRLRRELKAIGSAEVLLFHSRYYRPQNALLAIQTSLKENSRLVQEIFLKWQRGEELPPLAPEGRLTRSSYGIATGDEGHVLLLLPDPDPTLSGSAIHEVAWQLLCMDGNGGIFARKLAAKGIGNLDFVRGHIDTGSRRLRSLAARVHPRNVNAVLQAFDEALQELGSKIMSKHEFRRARRRAAFLWNDRLSKPASRIRCFIAAELAGKADELDKNTLESIAQLDANSIISKGTARLRAITIVRGVKPKGATALPLPSESRLTPEVMTKVEPIELAKEARQRKVTKTFNKAIEMLGGKKRLLALGEFTYRSHVETMASIPFTESWQLQLPDGPFVRKRRILGTEIVNRAAGGKVTESYGGKTDTLERAAAELFRLEAHLLPTTLLSYMLRKKSSLDLIGRLESGDRNLLILEFLAFGQKIRIGIDEDNHLIRRLYYAEWRANTPPKKIMLRFQDYRPYGPLKLPHRIYRFVDGERRSEVLLKYGG